MRTVTAICLAAVAGTCLALFLLAVLVAQVNWVVPAVSFGLAVALIAGALAMARQAGTPGCLPLAVFVLATGAFFLVLWTSWE